MRPKALTTFMCCLAISDFSFCKDVNATLVKNNKDYASAASVNQLVSLFKDAPMAIYASAVPHGSYSFHAPTYQVPQKPAANVVPVHNENLVIHKQSGFLTDSYGNKFLETPQSVAYKATLPQQFVPLQDLPAHLAQPFVAAAPGFQFKQSWPQFGFNAPINVPQAFQTRDTPLLKFGNNQQSFPLVYAEKAALLSSPIRGGLGGFNVAQQPTNQKVVYSNTGSYKPFQFSQQDLINFQRLEQQAQQQAQQQSHHNNELQSQKASTNSELKTKPTPATPTHVVKITTIDTTNKNNRKIVHTIPTKPSLPNLLDLSLLEPLVFENPVVPQVQHYLPKITYDPYIQAAPVQAKQHHKEFLIQNTKSYDGPIISEQGIHHDTNRHNDRNEHTQHRHPSNEFKPHISQGVLHQNDRPHYDGYQSHGGNHQSHQPNYNSRNNGNINDNIEEEPKHLIYHESSEEQEKEQNDSSENDNEEYPEHRDNNESHEDQRQYPVTPKAQYKEERYQQQHHEERPKSQSHHEEHPKSQHHHEEHSKSQSHHEEHPQPQHHHEERPKPYYHNEQRPKHHHNEDRHKTQHHEQRPKSHHFEERPKSHHHHEPQTKPHHHEKHYTQDNAPKHYKPPQSIQSAPQFRPLQAQWQPQPQTFTIIQKTHPSYAPSHVEEKPKRIIVKEETPINTQTLREQMMAEVIKEEENNEEDFDKAYKEAALGFPAYNHDVNHEKDIYNPASYGVPRYHESFDISNSPFEQYFLGGDDFPKSSRLTYKEMRDHNTDNYFKDFIAKQPKRLGELKQTKKDYYKSYKDQKSPHYSSNVKHQKSRPDAIYGLQPKNNGNGNWFAQYKAKPIQYEFDYSKSSNPKDSYAHATKPSSYRNKWSTTQFVEPQFQYGFEPIPKLLDSELAAMASNNSPESEAPGSRKKIYKENWYLHKTSTTGKS